MRPLTAIVAGLLWFATPLRAADIVPDVVYGHKDGMALTYDVIKPAKPNGAAVLWVQSGGWYSRWLDPKALEVAAKPYLDGNYTVVIVRHGSAPKYAVPDAVADVRRCVRAVRLKAKEFGIDPERLGIFGGSAGGHLSLMVGTTGDEGDPKAKDEVLRTPCRVAAVVAIFPPTDLRGWTDNPPDEIKKHADLKPPLTFDAKLTPEVSPLLKVTAKTAPTLLVHGDKDVLVPIEHSRNIMTAFEAAKVPSRLVTIEGAGHGFSPKQNQETVVPAMMAWWDKYLGSK
ncbi:MAG: alpha/beta hydrolase [Gemmataceae bacterium]